MIAATGTPVHAICAGTVRDVGGARLRIEGEDGHTCEYAVVHDPRVTAGDRVDGGAILGVLGAGDDGEHALRLAVVGRDQTPVRTHDLLLGAADPNELGYGPVGTGIDVDPEVVSGSGVRSRPVVSTSTQAAAQPREQPVARGGRVAPRPPVGKRPAPQTGGADAGTSASTVDAGTTPLAKEATVDQPAESRPVGGAAARLIARRPAGERVEEGPAEAPVEDRPAGEPAESRPVGGAAARLIARRPTEERVEERPAAAPVEEPAAGDPAAARAEERPAEEPVERPVLRLPEEPEEEPDDTPSAAPSAEEQRKRAAMLIASRRRRSGDSGPAR